MSYLSNRGINSVEEINKIFVSAYVLENNIQCSKNHIIGDLLLFSKDEHFCEVQNLLRYIKNQKVKFTIEVLCNLFEFVISPSDRIVNGAIYTPEEVRSVIVSQTFSSISKVHLEDVHIADISCGCGCFLKDVALKLHKQTGFSYAYIYEHNLYGLDIQDYSIERTKIVLSLLALTEGENEDFVFPHIVQANSLSFNYAQWPLFDAVVGNPPYVCSRHMDEKTKLLVKQIPVCQSGHPDLYLAFFWLAIEHLQPNGFMGYITMNSFTKSLNGRAVRRYLQEHQWDMTIIDFKSRQIFKAKSTYTCLCFLSKKQSYVLHYGVHVDDKISRFPILKDFAYANLDAQLGWSLSYDENYSKIESIGNSIGAICASRHGLATLSNKTYIFKPFKEDDKFYYRMYDNVEYAIEKGICVDVVNPNRLSGTVSIEQLKEKLIFPYTKEEHPRLFTEDELSTLYPCSYQFLRSCQPVLAKRDKGHGKYPAWYAFGRTQSLQRTRNKLFLPKISNRVPRCELIVNNEMYFYNGQAFISDNVNLLKLIKKIIESDFFWHYIVSTSKPYGSNYYSLNGNYIKNFGIPNLNAKQRTYILNETNQQKLSAFFRKLYNVEKICSL